MTKRERLINAFNNEAVDRPPVGFWFHFLKEEDFGRGLEKPELIAKNISSHKEFIEKADPDFVKIMSDGFFLYPSPVLRNLSSAQELKKLVPIGENHQWIKKQLEIVKAVTGFLQDTSSFYNVFSPATFLRIAITEEKLIKYFREDPEAIAFALEVIAQDLVVLSKSVIKEAGADGIYLSVQNPGNGIFTYDEYRKYITPSEKAVLASANKTGGYNILHCCGYNGNKNNLGVWQDYDAKAVNWAVAIENLDLAEGKKFFGDKAVIGGFDNRPDKLLHKGSREEVENFTKALIEKSGERGVIIGADCTIPKDISLERLHWVKETVRTYFS